MEIPVCKKCARNVQTFKTRLTCTPKIIQVLHVLKLKNLNIDSHNFRNINFLVTSVLYKKKTYVELITFITKF